MFVQARRGVHKWVAALVPLLGLAVLLLLLAGRNHVAHLADVPPVEELTVERTVLSPGTIELRVRNTGPDTVTIAQVQVNEAYRRFAAADRTLSRLVTTWLAVPYPWEKGVPVRVSVVTSTGITFDHEIASPVVTPGVGARSLVDYGLLGVYIGVIPVALGLLWYPSLRRASRPAIAFFLAFTVGLLAFLFMDATADGLEQASETPEALGGVELFALGLFAVLALTAWLSARPAGAARPAGLRLAYLVAVGIGIHNLGEGLAVGAAVAAGEVVLGTSLVLGFAAHNATEGLAIAAPVAGDRGHPRWAHFLALAAVAGVPTVAGTWVGSFAFTPAWASLAFGIAAGAVVQVVWAVGRRLVASGEAEAPADAGAKVAGFGLGVAVMYAAGLLAV